MSTKCRHFNIVESCEDCLNIQKQWYKKLKGFEDIEDSKFRLLKKWTGVSDLIDHQIQEEESTLKTNWPAPNFTKEEELLNYPDLEIICERLFKHKNNVIKSETMVKIWRVHCEGLSLRDIGISFNLHNVTVFRAIRKLKELMKIMDLNTLVVVIRQFKPEEDSKLIYSTWRNSVWFDSHTDNELDPAFYRWKTKEIKKILSLPGIEIKIACSKDNPDHIIGYAILNINTIEFVYIKLDYRKEGIAKLLTKDFVDIAKPTTKIGVAIARSHGLKIKGEQNGKEENIRR